MRPACFKTQCNKVSQREPPCCNKVHKHEPKSTIPQILFNLIKRGFAITKSLLSIGAVTHEEDTDSSTTNQEDGADNHDAVASTFTTGKEKRCTDNDADKELDAGRSAMPADTRKRRRSLVDGGVYDPERVKLRKHDRLALLLRPPPHNQKLKWYPRRNSRLGSGYNADESDHAREENNILQRARHARAHRWPAAPLKKRSSVSEMQRKPSRVSRGAVTKRATPPTPKKRRRTLPGRYSALDTDEEEQEIDRILKQREKSTIAPAPTASRAALSGQVSPSTPEKRRRTLPGRYSALDTDEEEQEIERILKQREQSTVAPVLTASRAAIADQATPTPQKRRLTLPGRYSALDTDEEEQEIGRILKQRGQSTVKEPASPLMSPGINTLAAPKKINKGKNKASIVDHPVPSAPCYDSYTPSIVNDPVPSAPCQDSSCMAKFGAPLPSDA
ncbi:hypothetical protein DFQ26_000530 [Actinomortierella ambigua]|nr:hypothetical protein DFQ26_000530 [Actinomortierella ambigua]